MTGVTALGPWPGKRVLEAQRTVLGDLTDVPDGVEGLPVALQLSARGPEASSVARTAALLTDMPIELGTHGWKLADRPGADLGRVRALMREDLDALAVAGHDYSGPLVVSVRGPWTLAAILYLARGDRVLSDTGASRDLAASLADGIGGLLGALRTAVPGVQPVVVLREPMLPDVLAGTVATFSGHSRIPARTREEATAGLATVVDAARSAGAARVVAHGGVRFASRSVKALVGSGADGVGLAAASLSDVQWEQVAAMVEAGRQMWFGLPQEKHGRRTDAAQVARLVAAPWRRVGLPARGLADVVVHSETSGSVTGSEVVHYKAVDVRARLATAIHVAAELAERATDD